MLTAQSLKTVTACRFCWMCRHLCPVGLATGKENNGPRAKALFLYLQEKGLDLAADTAMDMYECALCNACAANCETGYEPPKYIRAARAELLANGMVPAKIRETIDILVESGNLYGADIEAALEQTKIKTQCKILVYAGATAAVKTPKNIKALMNLLEKAGLDAGIFAGTNSSGAAEYDLLGDIKEVHDICASCAKAVNDCGAEKLIVLNPSDAVMFKQQYPAWNISIDAEVITATAFVAELVQTGALALRRTEGLVTYHDPCRLARDLEEIEPARYLIKSMGYELKEMGQNGKRTRCCGGEVLCIHSPDIVKLMTEKRLEDAKRTGAEKLITACPGCSANFGSPADIELCDIFILLSEHVK